LTLAWSTLLVFVDTLVSVKAIWLKAGHCTQHRHFVAPGSQGSKNVCFPAGFALIDHAELGPGLFDTGYSAEFLKATRHFPERLYEMLTPVTVAPSDWASSQLLNLGIASDDIRWIFVSHFHGDHIAGLRDFRRAKFYFSKLAYKKLMSMNRIRRLANAFLKVLLPDDFLDRAKPFDELASNLRTVSTGLHLLGSGVALTPNEDLIAVSLPGHALGHTGLLLQGQSQRTLLVGDAAWLKINIEEKLRPSVFTAPVHAQWQHYQETLTKLQDLFQSQKDLQLVPSHCLETFDRIRSSKQGALL
jgi:glyoxylase-like metal-dependent hydrolase (beta-lactamase superfamily II)